MISENIEYSSGILPVFPQWTVFNEYDDAPTEEFTVEDAKEFLAVLGFCESKEYVSYFLSYVIAKNANAERVALGNEYRMYARKQAPAAFRSQIEYYIDKNFDRVQNSVVRLFDFPKNYFHKSIKNFTETLGTLLSRYGKHRKN